MNNIPLKVLIVDADQRASGILEEALTRLKQSVILVECAHSLEAAQKRLLEGGINAVYIDPLSLGLDDASEFVFMIRRSYRSIVFVLYTDLGQAEANRAHFYRGERRRFSHYFKLNKRTPITVFDDEVGATVRQCQGDLSLTLTSERITELQGELSGIERHTSAKEVSVPLEILERIQQQLDELKTEKARQASTETEKSVFLSYRFAEEDYVQGLSALLEKDGFSVITGQDTNTYISRAILDRIRSCQFFLCLMTKAEDDEKADGTFGTSAWLLEEKGAALAFGKKIVLMVEEGVTGIGGLQGDWQRIHFTPKGFTTAALKAVKQLKSYLGTEG